MSLLFMWSPVLQPWFSLRGLTKIYFLKVKFDSFAFRPSNLPAKTLEEEQRHRDEYKAIVAAAKKKDAQTNAAKQKQQKIQLKLEEQQAAATKHFLQQVLPNWEVM